MLFSSLHASRTYSKLEIAANPDPIKDLTPHDPDQPNTNAGHWMQEKRERVTCVDSGRTLTPTLTPAPVLALILILTLTLILTCTLTLALT